MAPVHAHNSFAGLDPVCAPAASAQTKILEMDPLGLGGQLAREIFRSLGDAPSDNPNCDRGSTGLLRLGESSRLSSALKCSGRLTAIGH